MLKIMVLRKRHKKMLEEAEQLRSKISGFKSREADVAAQVEAASTDEEIAAAAAAVEELEKAQKSAKERLATIMRRRKPSSRRSPTPRQPLLPPQAVTVERTAEMRVKPAAAAACPPISAVAARTSSEPASTPTGMPSPS